MQEIYRILRLTKQFSAYYFATGFFIILVSLLNLASPIINKAILDVIQQQLRFGSGDMSQLIFLLGLVIGSDLAITFVTNISGYVGDILATKLNTFLTSKFYGHVLNLELEYFDNELSGRIMTKLQRGIDNITSFVNQMLNNFLPFFLTALFTIIYLAQYSWEVAVLLAALFPLYILISDRSSKDWRNHQEKINKIQDESQSRIFESITSIRIVKSFLREPLEHKMYHKFRGEIEDITKKQSAGWHKFDVYRRLILNIILFAIYAYVVYWTFQGRYDIPTMVLLLQLVTQARFPLFAMSFILGQIQQAQAGSKDFFQVLDQPIQIADKSDAVELKNIKGKIAFKDVSFSYQNNKEVLHAISFNVDPGQKMAIVGESGEGKSTIANLLLRFYEPQSGEVTIDGQNIQNVTQKSLHKNIGVVLQDSLLFSGTIAENIRYGNADATDEQVIAAAKAANAHDFIAGFDKGYETEIGERGVKLSGGQKQRLSIARALLKDSRILILDEATSALDSKAELEVQKALNKLMEGRTTIIIAHRLATIKNVDHIIVLKNGKIVESGKPSELINQNGIYAELVKLQNTVQEAPKVDPKLQEYSLTG